MVSRKQILSSSMDAPPDEDVFHNVESLFKVHVEEVLQKWRQIDDEIWAKVIVFERNRRVAKAYVRSPILTVNSADNGFDGYRIGLDGFENPRRDNATTEIIQKQVGEGIKLRMDDKGNIQIKKVSRAPVYIKPLGEENAINYDLLKPNVSLQVDTATQVFSMERFEHNLDLELKVSNPDLRKVYSQCLFGVCFGRALPNLLHCPSWVMIINVVAMDMLKSRSPNSSSMNAILPNIRDRPRQPAPSEEDIYSMTTTTTGIPGVSQGAFANGTGSKKKNYVPPKLPPRGKNGGYDEPSSVFKRVQGNYKRLTNANRSKEHIHDDPYYSGLSARSTFAQQQGKDRKIDPRFGPGYGVPNMFMGGHYPQRPMFQTRSYESGIAPPMHPHNPAPFTQMPHNGRTHRTHLQWGPQIHSSNDTEWENYW